MADSSDIYGNDNKEPISREELEEHLRKQLRYLMRSCNVMDAGDADEAPRAASVLRTLLHHVGKSRALLVQLGLRDVISFKNTGIYRTEFQIACESMIPPELKAQGYRVAATNANEVGFLVSRALEDGTFGWFAPLDEPKYLPQDPRSKALIPFQRFDDWWTRTIVEGVDHRDFNRMHLVLVMANQDGGSHVDPSLDKDYRALCDNSNGDGAIAWFGEAPVPGDPIASMKALWKQYRDSMPTIRHNRAYASIRQIAYEVIITLRDDPATKQIVAPCFGTS
ncbi:hypothetical protein [Herbaspirillum sp. CAH-3]|uniref:hypothetical protein n=1 Tax=Herbaspirillum sp. CAH-3 TaxID=2605746 RepID=UPI0012AD1FA2|nr:hypothetical protein [Herbaspirillum sp. CAH-3]MRT27626.1 hypothetical protein [Herbaspirillum sp. CAH-3]